MPTDAKLNLVVVGAGGRLGAAVLRDLSSRHHVTGFNRAQLDLADPQAMRQKLADLSFDVLINCAAQTNVDRCETHEEEAFQLNGNAPGVLAQICAGKDARLIHISTDYVFDGDRDTPYREEDPARPISVYGASKLAGEEAVANVAGKHVVARVSWIFGPDRPSFVDWAIQRAREHPSVEAVADKYSTPSYTIDLARMLEKLALNREASGIFHLSNTGEASWQSYAQWAIDCCGKKGVPLKSTTVGRVTLSDMKNFIAKRPVYTVLATDKYARLTGDTPRDWHDAVAEYVEQHVPATTGGAAAG